MNLTTNKTLGCAQGTNLGRILPVRSFLRNLTMKKIPLTQGKFALVDDEDHKWLSSFTWCVIGKCNTCYTRTTYEHRGLKGHFSMHRLLMMHPKGMQIDHINHNGLDNRKSNLRIVTPRQNQQNRRCCGTSKFVGVSWDKHQSKWHAQINIKKKTFHLGFFDDEIKAADAYMAACDELRRA